MRSAKSNVEIGSMSAFNDLRKRHALVQWANCQLWDASDIIRRVETGERCQFIRVGSEGPVDETQKTYLKAMRDTLHLEFLLELLEDQSEHQRSDDAIGVPRASAGQ